MVKSGNCKKRNLLRIKLNQEFFSIKVLMDKKFLFSFLLNAIIIALISTITVEAKDLFDLHAYQKNKYNFDPYQKTSFDIRLRKFEFWKFLSVIIISFLVTLIIFISVYYLIGKETTYIYLFGNLDSIY